MSEAGEGVPDIEPLRPEDVEEIQVGAYVHGDFWPKCERLDPHAHYVRYRWEPET